MGGDVLKPTDTAHQMAEVGQHIQTQLNTAMDVRAAHQFISPTGGEAHLPNLGFGGDHAALQSVVPGAEQHAMAAAQQVGNQAISPIIQMIMKMPGHIGLMSSFFECLASFFTPVQDMLNGLDISELMSHADAAAHAVGGGEHLGLDISLIPDDAPVFTMDDGGGGFAELLPKDGITGLHNGMDLKFNPSEPLEGGNNALYTSGAPDGAAQFEQTADAVENATVHVKDGVVTNYLALDNSQPFFHSMGNISNNFSSSQVVAQAPAVPTTPTIHPLTHQIAPHHPVLPKAEAGAAGEQATSLPERMTTLPEHSSLPEHTTSMPDHTSTPAQMNLPEHTSMPEKMSLPAHPSPVHQQPIFEHSAAAQPAAASDHSNMFGHPRTEHSIDQTTAPEQQAPGTDAAQQQGGEQVADQAQGAEGGAEATTSYTVKPGDNLWDIAHKQLGDGLKWQEIYHLNQDILGGDPRMIQPGIELKIPGMNGQEIASNYTVQPGDNLWDISKSHLGGGEHWGDIYKQNTEIIGSNPSMIHPGQHLSMGGADHANNIASATPSQAAHQATSHVAQNASGSAAHHQVAHSTHSATHHVAQHHTTSGDHPKVAHAKGGDSIASNPSHSPDVIASNQAPEVGLKATAGSLDSVSN